MAETTHLATSGAALLRLYRSVLRIHRRVYAHSEVPAAATISQTRSRARRATSDNVHLVRARTSMLTVHTACASVHPAPGAQMMRTLSDKKARSAFKEAGAARDRDSFFQAWQSYVREWDLHHYTRYGASNYREGHIYGADHMTREGPKHGAGVQDSSS